MNVWKRLVYVSIFLKKNIQKVLFRKYNLSKTEWNKETEWNVCTRVCVCVLNGGENDNMTELPNTCRNECR